MPAPIARTLPVMAEDDSGTTDTVSPPFVTKATASRGGKDGCIPKNGAGGRARGCARIARAGAGPRDAPDPDPRCCRQDRRWMSEQGAAAGMEDACRGARHGRQLEGFRADGRRPADFRGGRDAQSYTAAALPRSTRETADLAYRAKRRGL